MNSSSEHSLHFHDYWLVVRNRWPIILTILILVVGTAVLVTRSMPKIYESTALVQIQKEDKDIQMFNNNSDQIDMLFLQTQFEVIKSKKILYPVIEKMGLLQKWSTRYQYDPSAFTVDQLYAILKGGYLSVQPARNTNLIEIGVQGPDRKENADIADAIATEYLAYRQRQILEKAQKGFGVVDDEMAKQKEKLDAAKAKVEEMRIKLGIDDRGIGTGEGVITRQETELSSKEALLAELRSDYLARRQRFEKVNNMSLDDLEKALPVIGTEDGNISTIKTSLSQEQAALQSLAREGRGPQHPQVLASEARIKELRDQLNKSIEGIRRGLEIDLSVSQAKLENQEREVAVMSEELRKLKTEIVTPWLTAKKEAELLESEYNMLKQRSMQQKVDSKVESNPVIIMSQAEPGLFPIKPNMKLNIGLSVAVGLFLGISLAFFIEYLDTSIKSLDDVERFLNCPVVGVVPRGVSYLNIEGPDSPNAEAYRILRAKIDFGPKHDGASTLTVVSGGPGEGKSTTLFNLAYVCAASGMKTLVVDADFRRHSIDHILNIGNEQGLADFLLGRGQILDYVRTSDIPNMHVIPAGRLPLESMGAMNPARMADAINNLRPYFHVILFDVPPILGMSDAAVIVRLVDYTLMVIQHRRYPRNVSMRVKKVVEEVNGRLLGVVLNNVHVQSDDAYYYHTSYYNYYTDEMAQKDGKKRKRDEEKTIKAVEKAKAAAKAQRSKSSDDRF